MKKYALWISLTLNVIFLFFLISLQIQKIDFENTLDLQTLKTHTYIPKRESKYWDTGNEEAYYLFADEPNNVRFTTFKQEIILELGYHFIGNGVYKLENDAGYIIHRGVI